MVVEGHTRYVEPLDGSARRRLQGGDEVVPGCVVRVQDFGTEGQAELTEVLAEPETARARLYQILSEHQIDPGFPAQVQAEVHSFMSSPGLDDSGLLDLTHLPFITIDNEGSRDLDQAMYIEPGASGGYALYYALADTSYYVRPGSALYAAAMQRGVTLYLPGLAVPMLPSEFSEGLVSLNEGVVRRALTMRMTLDARAQCLRTELLRSKILSRRKLTYEEVQGFFDADQAHPLAGQDFTQTLDLLRRVGELRIQEAQARDVVRINRVEVRHTLSATDPHRFETHSRGRNMVERWNEQVSLLCNAEGAKLMQAEGNADYVTPIFRVHPEPVERRLGALREIIEGAVAAHGADPKLWVWKPGQSLADYLNRLPDEGPLAGLAMAIQRQAVMVNSASEFSVQAGRHHGVGVDPYARFSSPMREMVGVYTHKEALEKLGAIEPRFWPSLDPKENQALVVELANRTRKLQNLIEKQADHLVLDQYLQEDLRTPLQQRRLWRGTILGLTPTKVYVQMQTPPFEVKLYLRDLAERFESQLVLDHAGAVARSSDPAALPHLRLGDEIRLKLDRYDVGLRRYVFTPVLGS